VGDRKRRMLEIILHMLACWPVLMLGPLFVMSPSCNCCTPAECAWCSAGSYGGKRVVISGMANGSCSDCANMDGTYILAHASSPGSTCNWNDSVSDTLCTSATTVTAILTAQNTGANTYVNFLMNTGFGVHQWRLDTGSSSPTNCSGWSSTSLPFLSTSAGGQCDSTSATCLVTSL